MTHTQTQARVKTTTKPCIYKHNQPPQHASILWHPVRTTGKFQHVHATAVTRMNGFSLWSFSTKNCASTGEAMRPGSLLVTWQRWPWPMAAATHGPNTEMDVLRWRWIEVDVLDRRANIYDDGNCTCISIIICEHTPTIHVII